MSRQRAQDHDQLLEGTDNLLQYRLRKMHDCRHQHEYVADSWITPSDSEVLKWYCPSCGKTRNEEITGSLSRAMGEDYQNGGDDAA